MRGVQSLQIEESTLVLTSDNLGGLYASQIGSSIDLTSSKLDSIKESHNKFRNPETILSQANESKQVGSLNF